MLLGRKFFVKTPHRYPYFRMVAGHISRPFVRAACSHAVDQVIESMDSARLQLAGVKPEAGLLYTGHWTGGLAVAINFGSGLWLECPNGIGPFAHKRSAFLYLPISERIPHRARPRVRLLGGQFGQLRRAEFLG